MLRSHGWRRWALLLVVLLGLAGLLFSFSRNAWLAFGGGLVALAIAARAVRPVSAPAERRAQHTAVVVAAVGLMALLLLGAYRDLVASRLFHPDIPVEATSLSERQRDAAIAVDLIRRSPWQGVGAGNYPVAAQALDWNARTVHNVPLLVAAELGLLGLLLLAWLGLAPFVRFSGGETPARRTMRRPKWTFTATNAPWVALLLLGLFDVSLWLTASWQAAVLLGLLAGLQGRKEEAAQ
jgi:O-antigen ligase